MFTDLAVAPSTARTQPPASWQPLLTADQAQHAWSVINAIAHALQHPPASTARTAPAASAPAPTSAQPAIQNSLALGATGIALFFAYLARVQARASVETLAVHLLDQVLTRLAQTPTEPTLYSGYTGVGWTLAHLPWLIAPEAGDLTEEVDQALLALLDHSLWPEDYDLIVGLVGFGVYALERLPHPSAVAILTKVIDHLADLAVPTATGYTWATPTKRLPPELCACHPQGIYNLGVAHGVPGIIGLLGGACAAGVAVAKARPLLTGAVRWLLAQPQNDGVTVGFPSEIAEGMAPIPARLAWCYGDPGIAATLLSAAHAVNEPSWAQAAVAIARRAAARPLAEAGVQDASLCHGTAGLGHLFNRMYQATGDPELAQAARFWFAETLTTMHQPGQGIAGYATWTPTNDAAGSWRADPGFLTGVAGIGLALLAAVSPLAPQWDRVLLVATPPRPRTQPSRRRVRQVQGHQAHKLDAMTA